jgi:UPF0716 protein FxsA
MRIFPLAVALFILVPILEIYLIIKVGSHYGAAVTILLIIATAVIGAFLLRMQGFSTLQRFQNQVQQGELPATTMLEGMMLFFAGALLLTPGFFTDAIGFLLLVSPIRRAIALWVLERSGWIVQMRGAHYHQHSYKQHDKPNIIEGDFERHDDEKK